MLTCGGPLAPSPYGITPPDVFFIYFFFHFFFLFFIFYHALALNADSCWARNVWQRVTIVFTDQIMYNNWLIAVLICTIVCWSFLRKCIFNTWKYILTNINRPRFYYIQVMSIWRRRFSWIKCYTFIEWSQSFIQVFGWKRVMHFDALCKLVCMLFLLPTFDIKVDHYVTDVSCDRRIGDSGRLTVEDGEKLGKTGLWKFRIDFSTVLNHKLWLLNYIVRLILHML